MMAMPTVIKRVLVGLALIAAMAGVLLLDWRLEQFMPKRHGLALTVLVALLVAQGYRELRMIAAAAGMAIFHTSGLIGALVIGTMPFWRRLLLVSPASDALTQIILGVVILSLFADQLLHFRTQDAIRRIGTSLLAVCYLGVCAAIVLGIRIEFGLASLVLFLIVVKATDVGAYFTGTLIGRHKLIPWLSPGKSWEGLIGGLALAAVCGVAFTHALGAAFGPRREAMGWLAAAGFSIVMGAVGQAADLCESAIKRDAGVKDAGHSLPAFGGVLDVLDSLLLTSPVAYVLLWIM